MTSGPRLHLCPLDRRHLTATRTWANDPQLCRLLDRAKTVSEAEHEAWYASLAQRKDVEMFAIETVADGTHIGNIWLWSIDTRHKKAEVRVVIGENIHQGRGLGIEAIELISAYARDSLNLHKLFAYVLSINPRALRAFEKAGFIVEGNLKQDRWSADGYVDVTLLGKILDQP